MEKVAPRALASVSRPRTSNAQRDPTRDQHDTDDWRNALTVTGPLKAGSFSAFMTP
jgi:hypothetical protein